MDYLKKQQKVVEDYDGIGGFTLAVQWSGYRPAYVRASRDEAWQQVESLILNYKRQVDFVKSGTLMIYMGAKLTKSQLATLEGS